MKIFSVVSRFSLLITALLVSTVHAQDYENRPGINIGGVIYTFDSERNQDDNTGLAIGGEYPLAGRWAIATDYFTLDSDVEPGTGFESDIDYLRLGVNYYLNKINQLQPYAGIGMGKLNIDPKGLGPNDSRESTVDIGVGAKLLLSQNWQLRADYKMIFGDNSSARDSAVTLGLSYLFGARSQSRPAGPTPGTPVNNNAIMDADQDGVPDERDACANTPAGAQVNRRGCELDSDRDGVVDSRDNCPDTSVNLSVDDNGCPVLDTMQRRIELLVNFDYDRSEVKAEYDEEIENFADFMKEYANTNAVIEGHTDTRGSDAYNQPLSERRANAVREELVNEYGIEEERVSAVGYGESRPVDTSNTEAGHARNRRIEAVLSVDIEEQRRR